MSLDDVRKTAMSLPHATEQIQWEDHLVFKVGGRIFVLAALHPLGVRLSLKSTPERFAELTELPGVIPAPYLARNHWIGLERWDALPRCTIDELIRESYRLVFAKLSKKMQAQLASGPVPQSNPAKKKAPKN